MNNNNKMTIQTRSQVKRQREEQEEQDRKVEEELDRWYELLQQAKKKMRTYSE